jgi:hypothetical protein
MWSGQKQNSCLFLLQFQLNFHFFFFISEECDGLIFYEFHINHDFLMFSLNSFRNVITYLVLIIAHRVFFFFFFFFICFVENALNMLVFLFCFYRCASIGVWCRFDRHRPSWAWPAWLVEGAARDAPQVRVSRRRARGACDRSERAARQCSPPPPPDHHRPPHLDIFFFFC